MHGIQNQITAYRTKTFRQLQVLSVLLCFVLAYFLYAEDKSTYANSMILLTCAGIYAAILLASFIAKQDNTLYSLGCWTTIFLIGYFLLDYNVVSSPALPWISCVPSLILFFMSGRQIKRTVLVILFYVIYLVYDRMTSQASPFLHTEQRDMLLLVSSLGAFSYAFFISMALWKLNRSEKDHLSIQAEVDELTGLMNRRAFHSNIDRRIRKSNEEVKGLAIAIVDIDNFKKINDTYGHPVGDEILKLVGSAIRRAVRENDIVARYGGEEFIILFDLNNENELQKLTQRVLNNVRDISYFQMENLIKVTLSGGAVYKRETERLNIISLVSKADKNLYKAKNSGKNKFVHCLA